MSVMDCPRCGRARARGLLCEECARALPVPRGLLPAHVRATRGPGEGAWLVDGFGLPHALAGARVEVGRAPEAELSIANSTVSREHAELRADGDGWQVRDLASKNGTFVDNARITGRARLMPGGMVRFGGVGFYLIVAPRGLPGFEAASIETTHAADAVRYQIAGAAVELCLLASAGDDDPDDSAGGGVLLHRPRGAPAWSEINLPRLEHQLLRVLCEQAAADQASPAATRGTVATKALARKLAFQTRYANEENVRQVVRRLRASLGSVGAEELVGSVPGRGYFLAWPLTTS